MLAGARAMEALWVSTIAVAIAEIGDKTQLLAIILAVRYRAPVPIILGILVATLANHALAALVGASVSAWLQGPVFQGLIGVGFLAMAAWALIPDKDDEAAAKHRGSVFITTLIAFFLVEIGDKTQVATALLAARFQDLVLVTAGTTLGMMLANVPAVFLGEAATKVVPLAVVRMIAAAIMALMGLWALAAAFGWLPGLPGA
jgi:putative Ca2+/H+ antiporter (TMEM165/GDT1 family)